ncbi:MAG: conserved rane protein of unknown function [Modestobacter sp.]|jgi:hypothetical protein|nr:conserved rane protein of unknown function [Modestobacter sp.]
MLIGWLSLAVVVALPLGLAIRGADRRELGEAALRAADHPVDLIAARRPTTPLPPRRRRIPVPPLGVTLIATGVGLEAIGFVLRTAGQERGTARLLSMDAPMSVPRLFVTALFAVAAVAAVIGAARSPGRRTWWLSVAAVAAIIAEVKGGGTVHVRALQTFGVADHPVLAAIGSTVVVAAVLGTLFWVSRAERRDRRRMLLAFGLYGVASVGLSALSTMAGSWSTLATFVEESGEVVGGVAVLVAVLVGVAPRLVLPADWALRRTADAQTIDAPGALPAWPTGFPERRG